jgi:hypothetical protein
VPSGVVGDSVGGPRWVEAVISYLQLQLRSRLNMRPVPVAQFGTRAAIPEQNEIDS